jgi:FkbH-like protein
MQIEFVGDVITQPFSGVHAALGLGDCTLFHHGIDQHFQVLMSVNAPEVLVCHTSASFFLEDGCASNANQKMASYSAAVLRLASRGKCLIVINTLLPAQERLVGTAHIAHLRLIAELNAQLFDCAASSPFISIADLAGVLMHHGVGSSVNAHNDLVMRMPYTRQIIPHLISEYARVIRERYVARKKVIVLDADNTLWSGIVGEDGIGGIDCGLEFPGIVHRKFQQALAEIRKSGVVLALASKNNEADAREAFDTLAMPLSWDDFSAKQVNWGPKSHNIALIAKELGVGLDSMVFIDDNPFEIEQVQSILPMVECHRFEGRNANKALKLLYQISDLGCWDVTAEDTEKTVQYKQEAQRKSLASSVGSIDDYIASLGLNLEVGINRKSNVRRIAQLTNKTNQFNLTTRRYSESEVMMAMEEGKVFDFRVIDKFGDMGIVGVVILRNRNIETFLMSCRALGRKIEQTMLDYCCRENDRWPLIAEYVKTEKNTMVSDFYDDAGVTCTSDDGTTKSYRLDGPLAIVGEIEIKRVD